MAVVLELTIKATQQGLPIRMIPYGPADMTLFVGTDEDLTRILENFKAVQDRSQDSW